VPSPEAIGDTMVMALRQALAVAAPVAPSVTMPVTGQEVWRVAVPVTVRVAGRDARRVTVGGTVREAGEAAFLVDLGVTSRGTVRATSPVEAGEEEHQPRMDTDEHGCEGQD